jgi:hypothetical protein
MFDTMQLSEASKSVALYQLTFFHQQKQGIELMVQTKKKQKM